MRALQGFKQTGAFLGTLMGSAMTVLYFSRRAAEGLPHAQLLTVTCTLLYGLQVHPVHPTQASYVQSCVCTPDILLLTHHNKPQPTKYPAHSCSALHTHHDRQQSVMMRAAGLGLQANFLINGMHELGHGHVFRTRWLNGVFMRIFSFLGYVTSKVLHSMSRDRWLGRTGESCFAEGRAC